jgi:Domain of unknown function (DUF4395)
MNLPVDCPVDFIPVNENKVRLTALWVLLLLLLLLSFPIWHRQGLFISIFLAIDFFLRAFNLGKYSPFNKLSELTVRLFHISNKSIDQAPKRFAAKIGFILSLVIIAFLLTGINTGALILAIIFALFAFLESFLGFCAGCYVYSFLKKLKLV